MPNYDFNLYVFACKRESRAVDLHLVFADPDPGPAA